MGWGGSRLAGATGGDVLSRLMKYGPELVGGERGPGAWDGVQRKSPRGGWSYGGG